MLQSILIRNAQWLVQARDMPDAPLRGADMASLPCIENGYILIENGSIAAFGPDSDAPDRADHIIDAAGRAVLPGWCDSHTHLVFARSREGEFVDRINGLSYEEIARRGGGILNSAGKLRDTPDEALLESASRRLDEIISFGTTAVEIKSGYGLSLESELKMLRVVRKLRDTSPIPIKATFLGAHALPPEYRDNRDGYLDLVINEMLPRVVAEGLADYIDVFCERGFFTTDEATRIIQAGASRGLKAKIHVNQLANSGGVQVGVAENALSVDHLECIGDTEIELLANSSTIATLLPSCSFFLNAPYAPGRELIDRGAAVALATDYNPGSTPSGRIPLVISLACIKMKLQPEEAINAVTINGAFAMEEEGSSGVIAVGRPARLIITRPLSSLAYIPYAFGSDHIEKVVLEKEVRTYRDVVTE